MSGVGVKVFAPDCLDKLGIDQFKPWLILGKGPSFSKFEANQYVEFSTVSLNHAVKLCRPDLAHFIDLDAYLDCQVEADQNARAVVIPWQPHVNHRADSKTLEDLVGEHPSLHALASAGRLLTYNLSTGNRPRPGAPTVRVVNFSAEAVVNLLANSGAKKIRTLGVDGGKTYSDRFGFLGGRTLLANGQGSFDTQFREFSRSAFLHGLDFGPADLQLPVRIFVGSAPEQELACQVLEFSIRRRSSLAIECVPLYRIAPPHALPKDLVNSPRTPFSFQRFQIPELCGYQGRAIYLDSDMQVFRDIRELWLADMGEAHVLATRDRFFQNRKPQFSVMLIDCERARWNLARLVGEMDLGSLNYPGLMEGLAGTPFAREVHPGWNSLERFNRRTTRLVHYTDMPTQPWISLDNPLERLWLNELLDALMFGAISVSTVKESVERGWVRPSLLEQVLSGASGAIPRQELRRIDAHYEPPWQLLSTKDLTGKSRKKYSLPRLVSRARS